MRWKVRIRAAESSKTPLFNLFGMWLAFVMRIPQLLVHQLHTVPFHDLNFYYLTIPILSYFVQFGQPVWNWSPLWNIDDMGPTHNFFVTLLQIESSQPQRPWGPPPGITGVVLSCFSCTEIWRFAESYRSGVKPHIIMYQTSSFGDICWFVCSQ